MTRLQIALTALAGLLCLAGCGPTVTVQNTTRIPIRALITSAQETSALSPSPGESASTEVSDGTLTVVAMRDADWSDYAKTARKLLNDRLADSSKLSGPQLLDVVQQLKAIAAKMQEFEKAAGAGASCAVTVSSDNDSLVTVSVGSDGKLTVSCK